MVVDNVHLGRFHSFLIEDFSDDWRTLAVGRQIGESLNNLVYLSVLEMQTPSMLSKYTWFVGSWCSHCEKESDSIVMSRGSVGVHVDRCTFQLLIVTLHVPGFFCIHC